MRLRLSWCRFLNDRQDCRKTVVNCNDNLKKVLLLFEFSKYNYELFRYSARCRENGLFFNILNYVYVMKLFMQMKPYQPTLIKITKNPMLKYFSF